TTATEKQALALTLVPAGNLDAEVPLGGGLTLTFEAAAQVGSGAALVLRPDDNPVVLVDAYDSAVAFAGGRFVAAVSHRPGAVDGAGGPGLTGALRLGAEAASGGVEVFVELHVERVPLVVTPPAEDGLLSQLMPSGGVVVPVSWTLRWSNSGLRFTGAAGLE